MKYILVVVFILIVTTLYFVFGNDTQFHAGKPEQVMTEPVQEQPVMQENDTTTGTDDDARYQAMQAEFEKLEKARRNLERKLSRLKALLWDMEFPAEKSIAIKEQMQSGYALLKNKKLLGAYRELDDIKKESSEIEFVYNNLNTIEEEIREIKKNKR